MSDIDHLKEAKVIAAISAAQALYRDVPLETRSLLSVGLAQAHALIAIAECLREENESKA